MEQLISFESGGAARDEKVGGEHTLVAAAANGSSSQPTRRIGCSLFGHPYNQWRPATMVMLLRAQHVITARSALLVPLGRAVLLQRWYCSVDLILVSWQEAGDRCYIVPEHC
ncbi:predicted protein [Lichtheimia corymbifera JMRC:FSU:9682]|uniref:Uncharacterized protein n=1 Tax=Lichtheimia corymbifera JMRC:FSU:9682 TaxID=1263082 RepID=A0A068RS48_9FUNG|nr:predicted protein [Lichtheimia corymbifera JMRC:FSU:9682]